MNNKIYRKELLCNYLLNKDLISNEFINNNQVKVTFRKDEPNNLLYSKVCVSGYEIPFIYKLSKEIENCKKIEELKNKKIE